VTEVDEPEQGPRTAVPTLFEHQDRRRDVGSAHGRRDGLTHQTGCATLTWRRLPHIRPVRWHHALRWAPRSIIVGTGSIGSWFGPSHRFNALCGPVACPSQRGAKNASFLERKLPGNCWAVQKV